MKIIKNTNINFLFTVLSVCVVACSPSAEDMVGSAQSALDASNFSKALNESNAALKNPSIMTNEPIALRFEIIRLHALASSGQGQEVVRSLERLNEGTPKVLPTTLYLELAYELQASKDVGNALNVLRTGDRQFPEEHEKFGQTIQAYKDIKIDPPEIPNISCIY